MILKLKYNTCNVPFFKRFDIFLGYCSSTQGENIGTDGNRNWYAEANILRQGPTRRQEII